MELFDALLQSVSSSGKTATDSQKTALLVHATCISNGYVPTPIIPGEKGYVCLLPEQDWLLREADVFCFNYVGGTTVKCLKLSGNKMAVHFLNESRGEELSLQIDSDGQTHDEVIQLLTSNIIRPRPHAHSEERLTTTKTYPSSSSFRVGEMERAAGRRRTGELVGPNHPIFTGNQEDEEPTGPRFDPIGPAFIGEPDTDHFPPPPFGGGQPPPAGRRHLRGPHANVGPGGMFM